jgi:predicted metalloendopeptidase
MTRTTAPWTLTLVLVVATAACRGASTPGVAHGIDVAGMDRGVQPGDDFNAYVNGGWIKATPIPPDKSSYGPANVLVDRTRQQVVSLIQESASKTSGTEDERRIGAFYASVMDEKVIEAKGLAPLQPQLAAIAALTDRRGLARYIGSTLRADVDPLNNTDFQTEHLFGVWVTQALEDPTTTVPYLLQGGLGMPDREYYVAETPQMTAARTAYQAYVAKIFELAGIGDAAGRAARVLALETKMARVHATRLQSDDVHAPQTWTRADFTRRAPGLDWPVLFDAAALAQPPAFIVWHPAAVTGLAALVGREPLDAWKDWLTFHTINEVTRVLPAGFVDASFAFYGKTLAGALELQPRWQRAVDLTSAALGDSVGKVYVARYFPAATREKVQAMAADLVKAFDARIDRLSWMSPATKAKAKEKLHTLRVGVGYPDRWRDDASLQVADDDALGNLERARLFEYRHQLSKLGRPIDRGEWWMTPQTVNAVNLPLQNALNFPAAFLQPPFFDPDASAAHNYGSMGAVIGHEISHSFDDMGSQFDAAGMLANWWTPADFDHFHAAAEALAVQFDAYRPFPDLAVNGHQTLGENIADVAGLAIAYDAYRLSLQGRAAPEVQGFSGDQQFFISFGQSWRQKIREAALRQEITTDGHAPEEYRADTVRNLDAWYDAFDVQPGQKLFLAPDARVRIW